MSRKALVWWAASVAVVVVVVAALVSFFGVGYSPGPKPVFPKDSGVLSAEDPGPIPPDWDDGEPKVAVGDVGNDWAWFSVDAEPYPKSVDIRVGEAATLEGVTIALCETWYNKRDQPGGLRPSDPGAPLVNPSIAYYVISRDGSVPTCP